MLSIILWLFIRRALSPFERNIYGTSFSWKRKISLSVFLRNKTATVVIEIALLQK